MTDCEPGACADAGGLITICSGPLAGMWRVRGSWTDDFDLEDGADLERDEVDLDCEGDEGGSTGEPMGGEALSIVPLLSFPPFPFTYPSGLIRISFLPLSLLSLYRKSIAGGMEWLDSQSESSDPSPTHTDFASVGAMEGE